jgi:hypothetical protein
MSDIDHYIKKIKEHEQQRVSTTERNAYWQSYQFIKKDPFVSISGGVAVTSRKK